MPRLTLLQLSLGVGGKPLAFAPHIWKTLLDLRTLGLDYAEEFVVSAQLEKELPERFGLPKVTIPTLIVHEDDQERVIVDSFDIACYLEERFSTPRMSLFSPDGNASVQSVEMGKSYARFVEHWVNTDFANVIRPALLAPSLALFPKEGPASDPPSRARFESKVGPARMHELAELAKDPEWCADVYARARKELSIVDNMLRDRQRSGGQGPFLTGAKPTHADFALFAFYPYSLTNPQLVENVWRHSDLPYVGDWLDAIFASGLVSEQELLPHALS